MGDWIRNLGYNRRPGTSLLIPAATAIPLPKQLDSALAAAVLLQGLTAYILLDRSQVKNGDTVLVAAAAGGVGGLAAQLAKLRGAKVIARASESRFPFFSRGLVKIAQRSSAHRENRQLRYDLDLQISKVDWRRHHRVVRSLDGFFGRMAGQAWARFRQRRDESNGTTAA